MRIKLFFTIAAFLFCSFFGALLAEEAQIISNTTQSQVEEIPAAETKDFSQETVTISEEAAPLESPVSSEETTTSEEVSVPDQPINNTANDTIESSQLKLEETGLGELEAAEPPQKIIKAIEVKGNKAISTNTVVSKLKTRIGSPYQETVISDDLKRLYLLGFFSDIKIDSEDYKDGVKVIITVIERPLIEKIAFTGTMHLTMKEEKIKEQLKSKESQYLDYPNLSEDVRIINKIYEKIGYNQAKIEYKVNINKDTNKATIEFVIDEGKKVKIKEVLFEGNKAFSGKRIIRLMKTRPAWLFNAGLLKEEVLKEDMERIKAFYRKNGYADAKADYQVSPYPKKAFFLVVTVKIQEGKKFLVGNVTIQGNKDIPEKDILNKITECVPGKVFSQDALKQDISSIQGLYFDRGYISCQVQETTSVNNSTGRVDITYSIVENEVAYVNKIKMRGNVKTKDVVIRREVRIHPGDRFDGDKLRRSKERLQNLGFFDEVSYDTEDTDVPNKKDLIVEVKESKTGAFSFGGGYSTVDQFVGFVEVEQKNFDWRNWPYFTGGGQDLRFRGSFGTVTSGFEMSFTEPWLFDYPISFGFDAYQRQHQRDSDVGYGYDEKINGGDLRLGRELNEYLRGDLMYRYDSIKISNITDNATNDLLQEAGTNNISSITPSLTFDSRDNVFDTRKGNYLTTSYEYAGGPLGGDKDYWKSFNRVSHYFPMPRGAVLEARVRVGVGQSNIPIYERFFAGGASTIRGYKERRIGPIDPVSKDPLGGNALFIGNMEYTYPLFSFLKVAGFYDSGNVWDKLGNFFDGGFKSGFGLGVRIKTPIGPISLDYGIPMSKAPGEEKKTGGRFHFSASHGF
ncbi:MAG: outer membrane protein assembly factor BamA [Candidatus Omnitrophica bacterium]|nr:outer membrane protein assembly factor BamA [Candidatus Omnitrophota bacterium]MBU1868929.1 outer membrane protein assembly factor BamA [Candidatus Omnitrophota bacterium]